MCSGKHVCLRAKALLFRQQVAGSPASRQVVFFPLELEWPKSPTPLFRTLFRSAGISERMYIVNFCYN